MIDIEGYKKFFNATTIAFAVVRSTTHAFTGSFFVSEYEVLAKLGYEETKRENPSMELLKAIEDRLIEMANKVSSPPPAGVAIGVHEIMKPGQARFKEGGILVKKEGQL